MTSLVLTWALLAAPAGESPWTHVDVVDGITLQQRAVEGSKFVQLRLTTTTDVEVKRLCDAVFGTGRIEPGEPDIKSRVVVSETENERVTYEIISPPVASDRDYGARATRTQLPDGACRVTFEAANDLVPKSPEGFVRIEKLKGAWTFEHRADGKTGIEYVIHTDPAGALPAFLVEGSRRRIALRWVKLVIGWAKKAR